MRSRSFFRHILGFVPSVSVVARGRDAHAPDDDGGGRDATTDNARESFRGDSVGAVVLTPSGASSSSLYVVDLVTGDATVTGELARHVLHAPSISQ